MDMVHEVVCSLQIGSTPGTYHGENMLVYRKGGGVGGGNILGSFFQILSCIGGWERSSA